MFGPFAHHAEAFFKVEINGRDCPDGMTEHVIFAALALMAYRVQAGIRDFRRWKRGPAVAKA